MTKEAWDKVFAEFQRSAEFYIRYCKENSRAKTTTPKEYGIAIQGRRRKKKGKARK